VIVENPGPGFVTNYEQYNNVPNIYDVVGTSNQLVTIAPYSNGIVIFTNCGPNNGFSFTSCEWLKVSGFQFTNNYRPPDFEYCTNCEIFDIYSGCEVGVPPPNVLALFTMYNWSQHNYIHNSAFGPSDAFNNTCYDGGAHGAVFGDYYMQSGPGSDEWDTGTLGNIIEINIFYNSGHDCLAVYGQSNVVQYNWACSPPWINTSNFGCYPMTNTYTDPLTITTNAVYWGSRVLDIGGGVGTGNLIQSNTVTYGGMDPDGPGAITCDNGGQQIVRFNTIVGAAGNSIQVYDGKWETYIVSGSNYIYNNSMMFSGFNSSFLTSNGSNLVNIQAPYYPTWQTSMAFRGTSNNFVVNNLDYWSFTNTIYAADGASLDFQYWANNFTNTINPLWVNTNNTLKVLTFYPTDSPPDFHIESNSPALLAGTWIAYITSVGGSGTSFVATNASAFWAGTTAAWRTIPGDTISIQDLQVQQSQSGPGTAVITSIVGNTITITDPSPGLYLTNGEGIAIQCSGVRPNVGAYGTE
jgi:hypothetical protein